MEDEKKKCLYCGEPIIGRVDKKFCCDSCRNSYNYEKTHKQVNVIRKINGVLARNHNILTELNPSGKGFASKQQLTEKGFDFKYFTSTYTTKAGAVYHFVYDQGYVPKENDNDHFVLVKNADL
jgi:predicted nucleic acid-binding Zn ribbon protein